MIGKETWKTYKTNFAAKSSLTAIYVFILSCTLLLNILFTGTIIITIPFIVLPFTFAYFSTLCGLPMAKDAPIKSFFLFYPVYYSQFFFGGFRALLGFLKAFLVSTIFSVILSIILFYTFLRGQPGFAEILNEIEYAKDIAQMQKAMEHFYQFSPAYFSMQVSTLVGVFFGTWVFIRHCLLNSEKFCLNLLTNKPLPMKAATRIYLTAANIRRKQFYKEYYGAVWYVVLAFIVFFSGATSIGCFVFHIESNRSIFIGLFVALILLFPLIPYYFEVIRNIFAASGDDYSQASIRLSEEAINQLKKNNQLTPEQQKMFEEELQKSREEFEKLSKEIEEESKKDSDKEIKK